MRGDAIVIGGIKPFNGIAQEELVSALAAIDGGPLSGYLAGKSRGGRWVRALEDRWCETFHVKHAIACNSATSGLMAAAFAVGLKAGDMFMCPAMTMSATAAAPMFTGAEPYFVDVEDETFGLYIKEGFPDNVRAIFSTNLFGHPADLSQREWAKGQKLATYLIEDNAQSPFALAHGRYCGTMGDIGVWSLNVHKPLQCGEGGMVTTDADDLAEKLRNFINHGENVGGPIGLNLRMPEICAAIALTQLNRAPEIIGRRIDQAEAIISAIGNIPGLRPPVVRTGCRHVYYTIPFLIEENMRVGTADCDFNPISSNKRGMFCTALRIEGVPIVEGYINPLYRLPAFKPYARSCPVAADLQDRGLFYFENCAWDPTKEQIKKIGDAFKKAAEQCLP
jgi:dTDP-4-amino-4,6-dideoxygalactose transaminase